MFATNCNEGLVLKVSQDKRDALAEFYRSIEKRAYRMAEIETRSSGDALDLVQEAMLALMKNYTSRPTEEWRPLFYRILQNKIKDWHRRNMVRNVIPDFFSKKDNETAPEAEIASDTAGPEEQLMQNISMEQLQVALERLSSRQRQTFLLRVWEGFDVAETARIMGCSGGSVKTHLSRALDTLRKVLVEHV